ncbi:MAG: hypothetical protein mread185_000649 [Mycoplasmataceae bacterium]|nr:MAG: hypothetical protein mread185_000649 [Mycoplasmataceae bacterium]
MRKPLFLVVTTHVGELITKNKKITKEEFESEAKKFKEFLPMLVPQLRNKLEMLCKIQQPQTNPATPNPNWLGLIVSSLITVSLSQF